MGEGFDVSEEVVVRKTFLPMGALRRGAKRFAYSVGLTMAILVAVVWWSLLIWGAATLAMWLSRL